MIPYKFCEFLSQNEQLFSSEVMSPLSSEGLGARSRSVTDADLQLSRDWKIKNECINPCISTNGTLVEVGLMSHMQMVGIGYPNLPAKHKQLFEIWGNLCMINNVVFRCCRVSF